MAGDDQPLAPPNACALELLEPEIQRQILLQLDTVTELRNLCEASPRCLQVYLLNKQLTLSNVARRQFHPSVLSDALTFAKLSQVEHPCSRETVKRYSRVDENDLREWHASVSSISESMALLRLAGDLRFFIEDYARNTLPVMEELSHTLDVDVQAEYWPEKPVLISELSDIEIGRLQRAFCRFEIYRFLFARCSPESCYSIRECDIHPLFTPGEQAHLYIERLPDYQVEEISCVREYLHRRLRGIFTQLEDEAVNTFPVETMVFDAKGDTEYHQWCSPFYLFTHVAKYQQSAHIEYLSSLGLSYIRKIFQATGLQKRALFLRYVPNGMFSHLEERVFLSAALDGMGLNPAAENYVAPENHSSPSWRRHPDGDLDVLDTWKWAHPRGAPHRLYVATYKGLRDWGYVFWDFKRLHRSGLLKRSIDDIRRTEFSEWRAGFCPSVQERMLKPLGIWYSGQPSEDDYVPDDDDEPW